MFLPMAPELPGAGLAVSCSSFPVGRGSTCCGSIARRSLASLSQTPPAGRAALLPHCARDCLLPGNKKISCGTSHSISPGYWALQTAPLQMLDF